MERYENDCVDCGIYGKCGSCALNEEYAHYYCDRCGGEIDEDEHYSNEEYEDLCEDCLKDIYSKEC